MNVYEDEYEQYLKLNAMVAHIFSTTDFVGGITELIMNFLEPYVVYSDPYSTDVAVAQSYARKLKNRLPSRAVNKILEFMMPNRIMTPPIPSTITTSGYIKNFNFDSKALIDAVEPCPPHIESIGNIAGWKIGKGCPDPRNRRPKVSQGKPAGTKSKSLFGSAQTTFRVHTPLREKSKIFAVKVFRAAMRYYINIDGTILYDKTIKGLLFLATNKIRELNPAYSAIEIQSKLNGAKQWTQENVVIETLGGLYIDCRDTFDANRIVIEEMRRALNRPDIEIEDFHASMRNYSRFGIVDGLGIDLKKASAIFEKYDHIKTTFDINNYPSIILSIKVERHTSKKQCISVKIFPSGLLTIVSIVRYEHLLYVYRMLNDILIKHRSEICYHKKLTHDYDSDYYYREAGVEAPDISFRA
jgi:hypothetical protein